MDTLCQQVRSILEAHLPKKRRRLLIAVSGGIDSMVLLHVLVRVSEVCRLELGVAHFDHQLRGAASARDAVFVRRSAQALGLPVFLDGGDVKSYSRAQGLSLEMAARELRLGFLSRIAISQGFGTVATAHHADDQVELFLIRLLRGAGGDGLSGMDPVNRFPGQNKLRLIRPFLGLNRQRLADWREAHRIPFREDLSNRSLTILRNRIRLQLVPLLRRVNGGDPADNILRSMELIGRESELVTELAQSWLQEPISSAVPFDRLHIAMQRQVIRLQLLQESESVSLGLVEALRLTPGKPICSAPDIRWQRDPNGRIVRLDARRNLAFQAGKSDLNLVGRKGTVSFGDRTIHWELRSRLSSEWIRRSKAGIEVFDADKVGRRIVLRRWQAGDRFRPLGLSAPSKLQNLFINQKVPVAERRSRVVGCLSNALELFWVEGLRVSESFKVDSRTRRFLVWRWNRSS